MTNGEKFKEIFGSAIMTYNLKNEIIKINDRDVSKWWEEKYEGSDALVISPSDQPIEIALKLISATIPAEKDSLAEKLANLIGVEADASDAMFSDRELRQIAEHLLVYCDGGEE